MQLLDLPPELLKLIIDILYQQNDSRVTLSRLCRVCEDFRVLTEPYLYRDITLDWRQLSQKPRKPRALLCLTNFESRPGLASFVHSLEIQDCQKRVVSPQDPAIVSYLSKILERVSPSDRAEWSFAVETGSLDAWIALVVSQCSNIESLDVRLYPRYYSAFFSRMFYHVSTMLPAVELFPRLRIVYIGPEKVQLGGNPFNGDYMPYNYDIPYHNLPPMLSLPSLEHLHISSLARPTTDDFPHPPPNHVCSLRSLTLISSRIFETTLSDILRHTPSLRSLKYRAEIEATRCHYFSGRRLLEALLPTASTLRTLQVSVSFFSGQSIDVDAGYRWGLSDRLGYPDFRHGFPQLKNLEMPIAVLLGWSVTSAGEIADVIPANVERLLINDDVCWFEWYEWKVDIVLEKIRRLLNSVESSRGNDAPLQLRYLLVQILDDIEHTYTSLMEGQRHVAKEKWADQRKELVRRGADVDVKVGWVLEESHPHEFIDLDDEAQLKMYGL